MKQRVKKLGLLFMVLILILNTFNGVSKNNNIAHATDIVDINQVGEGTQIHQEGCDLVIKKTQETEWTVPRKPIDLVILQDTSGSFKNTIGGVKAALKTLTTPVKQTEYDPDNPRLVFTDTPETSDRVMVGSFQGLDGSITYDEWYSEYDYNERVWKQGYRSDTNFKKYESYYAYNPGYKVESTDLIKDSNGIHNFIDNMETEGGTPTVPALEEVLAKYKSAVQNSPEKMKNERKTVFLLITDGVANGVRRPDGKVVIEYSGYRQDQLIKAWGLDSSYYGMEASQNILARAKELTEAGKKLKNELGSNSSVVVGFWEDVNSFKKYGQYGDAYLNGYAGTGVNMNGDTRSVQEIFSSALRDVASPDKVVNGKPATFYVNEQNDINAFADKVLAAVGNALVKENVKGKFKITDGYKVKSVSINGKQIVDNVTDKKTQIKGEVKQNGNDVEISVPDAAFNPGKNKFDYELSRTEEAPETDEEDEVAPDDNYTPGTVERQVGELVGHFSVGDYQTAEIGSKGVKTVKVNELKYCYPNVKKSIKDQDPSNDRGSLEDPILTKRTAYAANLNTVHENFEYTVEYRMNNIPLNMKKNAMLVDPLNYRFDFLEAYVTDESGAKRPDFNIRTTKGTDPQTGKENTIVVADIPKAPGTNTETVKEGEYGAHKFKKYTLHVKVKFKDEYPFETNQSNYIKILQENDGLGPLNQAFIKWNGDSNSPTDETASVRRSNNVFVVPPVETNIEKKVRGENQNVTDGKEHYDLPLREDKFIYDIKSGWPGLAKKYVIEDTLKDELEIIKDENNSTKYDVNVLVNNKPVPALQKFVKVEGNKVKLELQEKDITRSLNIRINLANKGNLGPALIHIQIKAKIRDGANLDKYRDQNGVIKIPNISTVILNDNPKDSNIVTVTPDEPTITKKINETLDHLNIPSWEKQANAYNYNIKTALPSNIRDYGTYKVEDVLDQDLELQEGQQPFIKGSAADHFDVSYDSGSRKITAKIKDGHFNQIEGKSVVELVIPAKIKDGATREKIPNKAKVIYNKANATGEPKELETPPVTVTPPPSKPEITKKVNDKQHVDLQKLDEEFTYKVETTVPHNATNFEITDTIKDVLDFSGEVKAKVDGEDITDVKTEGKTLTVKLSEDQVKTKGGKAVVIEFKAKLKNGVTQDELKNYISEDKTVKVPNTAEYKINLGDRPELKKETPPVTVTPPPTTPEITKKVNDQEHVNLQKVDEEFTYKVETTVPHNATKFEVTDTIKDVLDFSGEVKAKVDGEDITDVKTEGKTLTVKLSEDQVKTKGGKAVVIEFKAKLKNGVTQDELKPYITGDKSVKVPNTAEYKINLGDRPELKKETPPVTVTPPPTTPEITKKVNDKQHVDLQKLDEEFTYKVETTVPHNATNFEITDTIKDVLEFVGDKGNVKAKVDGEDITDVKTEGKTLTVKLSEDQVKTKGGKAVVIEFKAKLKNGVTQDELKNYISEDKTVKVPNTAEYKINLGDRPELKKETPPVTVTPPPTTPEITKKVNDQEHVNLQKVDEEFTYKVETTVPHNATKFEVTDTIKDVLDFSGEVKAKVDGEDITDVKTEGKTLTVKLSEDQVKTKGGKAVVIEFKAKLKNGVTQDELKPYITGDKSVKVPNTAEYKINLGDRPELKKETPPVTVTPPPTTPEITKKVNDKQHVDLQKLDEEFTYKVETTVPHNATNFEITDTIKDVLEFVGDKGNVKAKVDGEDITDVKTEGKTLTVKLSEDQVKTKGGKAVVIEFKAKLKNGVTQDELKNYISEDKTVKVPNTAEYKINLGDRPELKKETPPVTVTPPPTTPEITKKVNDQEHVNLQKVDEEFTYKVETTVPHNATKFEVTDTIKDVLDFSGEVKAKVDGEDITDVKTEGKTLTVKLSEDQVKTKGGKAVVIEFKAKLKNGVTQDELKPYITGDKSVKVPNTAEYKINLGDRPELKKETPPVTVTPPPTTPEITKKVNGANRYDLSNRNDEFTYTLSTQMPANANKFEITDTIKDVLEFVGDKGTATVKIDGKDAGDKATVTVKDQTILISFTEDSVKSDAGKAIEVTFKSKIRDGANLSAYIQNNGKVEIPNKASYDINNDPKYHKDSNEVPVTPPSPKDPGITKKVNDKEHADLQKANEEFIYKVETTVPQDKIAFEVNDTIKDVLEFVGDVKATVDGEVIQDVKTDGQKLTVKLSEDQVKTKAGKAVVVEFKAKIKDGANLSNYVVNGVIKVPNEAAYKINNDPEKKSNTVTVTPPPSTPDIKKAVNGKEREQLTELEQEFTYTIDTKVPTNATAFSIFDTLENVLEFRGDVTATLAGKPIDKKQIKVNGQTVTVELTQQQVFENPNKDVHLEFKAKIRKGADLTSYIVNDLTPSIPNKAKYRINNNPGTDKDSNIVPVIPPSPKPPKEGEKSINSVDSVDEKERKTSRALKDNKEKFRYDIGTDISPNGYYKQFSITDELEKVLVPHKATIRISGDLIKEEEVLPELKKLKDKLKEHKEKLKELKPEKAEDKEFAKAVETAEAELTKAKTDLVKLKKSYNEIQDKDSAEATTAKGNVVKAEKAVEAAQAKLAEAKAKLAKANKPEKADEKVELEKLIKEVEDKIKEEEKTDKAKAVKLLNEALKSRNTKGEISDELAKKLGRLEIKGNKVEFEITDRTILKQLEGRKVTLSIYASIKEGADLSKYRNNGVTQIPNKAVIRFDHKPKVTNEVYVLPKIPPTIPPKTNIPPKKVLPKTGEHTNNLEWLGVMGIALILLRKRYSK